jgi:hypothetical protein
MWLYRMGIISLLTLPSDVMFKIILDCKVGNEEDRVALTRMACICKYVANLMTVRRSDIIEHYTVVSVHGIATSYKFCGMLHRENDLPAKIVGVSHRDGHWYKFGKLHRDNDLPAIIMCGSEKSLQWFINGKRHRDNDWPALVYGDGSMSWYYEGKLHRDDDQPAVIVTTGQNVVNTADIVCREWHRHGELHRDNDRPAVVWKHGKRLWYNHGKLHRANGKPAVIYLSGECEYYIEGVRIL